MPNWLFDALRSAATDLRAPFLDASDGRRWSYGDLIARTGTLARTLVEAGMKPGDRVAAQVEKSPEALLLYLATVRAGGVFLPLNSGYTPAEIDYFVGDAEPVLFVTSPASEAALTPVAERHGSRIETLDEAGGGSLIALCDTGGGPFEDVARGADDLAAILYTSGTTGRSKGAMLTHDNLLSNALALKEAWRFTSADRLIHALPIFHTHWLFVATNTTLAAGASMIFLPRFDPAEVTRAMSSATVLMGVPTFYVRLCQHEGLTREAAAGMRLFVSGSAPLLAETHRAFSEKTGHALLERYGMTETNMIASNPYEGERVPGAVGFPLPGVDLRIADPDTGAEVPQGEVGMIEVRGANVFKGYWRMPEKTKAEFRDDGFFVTGDLGRIDERGYVWIVGRGKDLVISGGYNVYPKEVEEEIDGLPGVAESAVIGVPHPDFGEGVTAVVVADGTAAIDEASILAALKDRLARFKQPKRVIVVPELPRNAMGKVQKAALRQTYADLYAEAPAAG
jgi:malonyl-CoA/methylmalonyl-CoA synthetase